MGILGDAPSVQPVRRKALLRDVGRRVAELRAERGLTQEDLADRLRLSSSRYLRRIEAGEINLTLGWLAKIANALHAPMSAFLERPGRRRAPRM